MTEPAALIFDCDGTLADTMPIHFLAWQEAIKPAGLVFDEDRFYSLGGVPTDKIIALLCEEQGKSVDVAELTDIKEAAYAKLIGQVEPIEPIVAIARENHGKLPLAVGSGGIRATVVPTLETIGILDLFDHIVTAEDTERHKPEPDVYLHACESTRRRASPMPSLRGHRPRHRIRNAGRHGVVRCSRGPHS